MSPIWSVRVPSAVRLAQHSDGRNADKPSTTTDGPPARRSRSSDDQDLEARCEISVNGAGARSIAGFKRPGYQNAFPECAVQTTATKRSTLARADELQLPSSYRDRSCFSFWKFVWQACWLKPPAHPSRQARVMDLAFYFSLAKTVTMFSWVWVLDGAGASWEVRETSSRIFSVVWSSFSSLPLPSLSTLYYGLPVLCEGQQIQRSIVRWRRWPTASLSSSQPKLLCETVTATPLQTWLCVQISFFFLFQATCEFIPIQPIKGSVTLDRSSRAAYLMLAEGVWTASYMNATGFWSR